MHQEINVNVVYGIVIFFSLYILVLLIVVITDYTAIVKRRVLRNNEIKQKQRAIILISIKYSCPVVFSHLNNTIIVVDSAAKGKKTVALFTLPADSAGNMRTFKVPPAPTSTNQAVAIAELGTVDEAAGTYELVTRYTGKNGSADTSLTFTNADDTTAAGGITSVITTEDVTEVGEPAVSDLQDQ